MKSRSNFQVVIRADAGPLVGLGHVMRMIALAQALQDRGAAVVFVVLSCPEALIARLGAEGFRVEQLTDCQSGSTDDAQRTVAIATALNARWIILDGYAFGSDFQLVCTDSCARVLCVDDCHYSDRWHAAALLNQNLHALSERHTYSLIAPDAGLWLGPRFALMRREFWRAPRLTVDRDGHARRVLVSMGGADGPNATALILEALALLRDQQPRVSVLVGISNSHRVQLEALCGQYGSRFEIIDGVTDMASLLEQVDAVITAGGSTCWEVLWARKPAAVLVIADNQQPIADSLQEQGLMFSLGRIGDATALELAGRLEEWLWNMQVPKNACPVDGKGARRVAAALDGRYSVTIATASEGWLMPHLASLKAALEAANCLVHVVSSIDQMKGGDFLLLLSYWAIVPQEVLEKYLHSLIVHESDLPEGRGWSPATWAILAGNNRIPLCLLEAAERVDSGDIYLRSEIHLEGHELVQEWRGILAAKVVEMCLQFIATFPAIASAPDKQPLAGTYLPRRHPADSQLDACKTLVQQFNLLRTVDNASYPAFFDHLGHRYLLRIEKATP